jgi:hypothetical protein
MAQSSTWILGVSGVLGVSVVMQFVAELDDADELQSSVAIDPVFDGVDDVVDGVDEVVAGVESLELELVAELLVDAVLVDAVVESVELEELESAALADWAASIATSTATSSARMAVVVRAKRMVIPCVGVVPHLEGTTGRPDRTALISTRKQQEIDQIRERPTTVPNPMRSLQFRVPMRISLEQQRDLYRRHADEAAARLVDVLRARLDELVALGFERAFDTVGVHEYGDATYWKGTEQLAEEAAAELADAIFYLHIPVAREHGDLPAPE